MNRGRGTEFDRDELIRLLNLLTAGTIAAEEHDRLEGILQKHPEARRHYFAFLDLDLGLRELALGRSAEIPPPVGFSLPSGSNVPVGSTRPRRSFRAYGIATAVAAIAIGLLFGLYIWRPGVSTLALPPQEIAAVTTDGQPMSDNLATLIFVDECHWNSDTGPLLEGQRLAKGELHLLAGLAMVRFDGGAVAVLSGDVRLDLESRGSVRLHHGRLTVQAPDEAVGFTVRTLVSDMVDLGTEFAVAVDRGGATELHVLDGAVEYREPAGNPGSGRLLRSGQAVRFDQATTEPRSVKVNAKPLQQLLAEAKPKPREDLLQVYEGFQYEPGSIPVDTADGGWGWKGPWRLRNSEERNVREPDSTVDMLIAFQKLNVPWPIRGGRAGMLELPPGNDYRVRPMSKVIDLGRDAVYYISMMMREEALADMARKRLRDESARLTFRSSLDYWGDRVSFALPGNRKPHIELADFIRFTGPEVPDGQSLLWVAKIAARRRGEDEVYFRVYQEGDSLDIVEPADWSIVSRGARSNAKLDLVLLTSTDGTRRWFDEFRIGTSWRAVVPIACPTKIQLEERSGAEAGGDEQ
jgi:ferric-dicitrate binding protein FerR (iron transport regulator)